MVKIGIDKIAALLDRVGKTRGEQILKFIRKQDKLVDALDSKAGTEILEEAITRLGCLLTRISDSTATDNEKAEYQALRGIVDKWATRITRYQKYLNDIRR